MDKERGREVGGGRERLSHIRNKKERSQHVNSFPSVSTCENVKALCCCTDVFTAKIPFYLWNSANEDTSSPLLEFAFM